MMKAHLLIISCLSCAVLLFSVGCKPEPKTTTESPAETVAQQPEMTQTAPAPAEQQSQPAPEQTPQPKAEEQMPSAQPAQPTPAEQPAQQAETEAAAPEQAQQPAAPPSPNDVLATANGTEITRAQVDELVQPRLERIEAQAKARKLSQEYIDGARKRLNEQALQAVIMETLVDEQIKLHNIVVTDQQIEDHVAKLAARENMTVDDLKALIKSRGKTYEQWKKDMNFEKVLAVTALAKMAQTVPAEVNETDARDYYEQNKQRYEQPEQVRASHILISVEKGPGIDPNVADADARKKAEQILARVKAGEDFAALAKEYSTGPSGPSGGDLGFGERNTWVKPFSDAAFALQPGQVSGVVKTRFGYHIIKVTDRKEARTLAFEEVKDAILNMLQARQEMKMTTDYLDSLMKSARITYAEGMEPQQKDESAPR
jgi:peptidyl-prolyl cis-trans isomerase C